jgi:hypothetical protein
MSVDDLLIAIIVAGLGLSSAYLRAELLLHRNMSAVQRRKELVQLKFHTKRVLLGQNDTSKQPRVVPSSLQTHILPVMRVLTRALRICIQERNIHRI